MVLLATHEVQISQPKEILLHPIEISPWDQELRKCYVGIYGFLMYFYDIYMYYPCTSWFWCLLAYLGTRGKWAEATDSVGGGSDTLWICTVLTTHWDHLWGGWLIFLGVIEGLYSFGKGIMSEYLRWAKSLAEKSLSEILMDREASLAWIGIPAISGPR